MLVVPAIFFLSLGMCLSKPVDLDGLKAGFERKTEEVIKPLIERHTGFLLTLERVLSRGDSLEDALLVREERVRIELVKGIGSLIKIPNAPSQLVALSVRFRRSVISAIRPWEAKYDKALVELLRQLQRAAKLEEALLVKGELEAFRKRMAARNGQSEGVIQGESGPNVALASAGAKAKAPKGADYLIDGVSKGYDDAKGYAWGTLPCSFIVEFKKTQRIGEVRFLLWDADRRRTYRYRLFVQHQSGDDWDLIADHKDKPSKSWQAHSFKKRAVRAVKIEGLGNSVNDQFHLVEIEAR